jgi:hypothetical protein
MANFDFLFLLQRSLHVISWGLFFMINWVSICSLAGRFSSLLAERPDGPMAHPYDWKFGAFQYVIGLTFTFIGLTSLEGAAQALASKASPSRLSSVSVHVSSLAVFLSFTGRIFADGQIFFVELSHKLINVDIVNSLVVPVFLACFVGLYFVKKHYFFLM